MNTFAIFGNPIQHSFSPQIHALFAAEIGISHPYGRILVATEKFEKTLQNFFKLGGLGANITMPFKERALYLCDQLTERSAIAGAVNTIKKQIDGSLLGDNTDGVGLIYDLQRLGLLHRGNQILLVGAGGAARGAIIPILDYGCKLVLTNRTFERAQKLRDFFYKADKKISILSFKNLDMLSYDLIINATSAGIQNSIPELPESIITSTVCCYDMCYQKDNTPFLSWSYNHGALFCANGLGMLVNQAALSFFLWHGIFPPIIPIIKKIRKTIYKD